ncbi:MAG TPA: peptidoglycan DD-metalloendopeptidase family protein [Candidatus Aquicultor sp.]|jgi:murein DD-endopeptidase MepM/ murein hydrolase activator NlpD
MISTTSLRHKTTALIIVALVLGLFTAPAHSSELSKKRNQLGTVKSKLTQTRNKIKETKVREQQLVGQIDSVDNRINVVQKEYDRLDGELEKVSSQRGKTENQLTALQAELWNTQQELDRTQARLTEQKGTLDHRMQQIYIRGNTSYLDFILNSSDFVNLLNRIRFLEFIVDQDVSIIKRFEDTKRAFEEKKAQVEQDKASVNTERIQLIDQERYIKTLTDAKRSQKLALQGEINKKQSLLSQIKNDRAAYELAEDVLLNESNSLVSKIRQLERSVKNRVGRKVSRPAGAGGFEWPTDGYVTSSFGMRMHPILHTMRMHTGVDIGAPYGQSVLGADDGVVIQAGTLKGYGQTVIIAHGNGISTLYGHLSAILVSEGESVSRGSNIGRIGSTGLSTGPHLHFEVRKDGEPQNPMSWY